MIAALNNVGSGATAGVTTLLSGDFGQIIITLLAVSLLGIIVGMVYHVINKDR